MNHSLTLLGLSALYFAGKFMPWRLLLLHIRVQCTAFLRSPRAAHARLSISTSNQQILPRSGGHIHVHYAFTRYNVADLRHRSQTRRKLFLLLLEQRRGQHHIYGFHSRQEQHRCLHVVIHSSQSSKWISYRVFQRC